MSVVPNSGNGKITVPDLLQRKSQTAGSHFNSQKITCLTAYDYPTARLLDEAGVDVDTCRRFARHWWCWDMRTHCPSPSRKCCIIRVLSGVERAARWSLRTCLTAAITRDLADSLHNAMRFVKEAGAEAVKVEGGERRLELISRLTEAEIPVMGLLD